MLGNSSMNIDYRVSLVVLTYNGWGYTHKLLTDIQNRCQQAYEVIVVDNGSQDPAVVQGLEFWTSISKIPMKVIQLRHNLGFIGGMNSGIRKATGDIIVALSNDVSIISDGFIKEIHQEFEKDKSIVAGPTLYTIDTGWNKFGNEIIPYVEGWCVACHKDMWNSAGMFDERYAPSDYEDVDFSYKAVKQGAKLVQLKSGLAQHYGAKTFGYNPERLARTHRNRKIFAEYWGLPCE